MRNVDTLQFDLAFAAYRDRVHHGTDRCHTIGFAASLFEGDRAYRALWQRLPPARHFRRHIECADHVVLVRQARAGNELPPIAIRVHAGRMGELIHEALAIELVRGLSDAAPRTDGY